MGKPNVWGKESHQYKAWQMFPSTFEEYDLMIAGPLVHRIHAVQVERQSLPEAMDLSWLKGHQVLVASQSPKILAWVEKIWLVTRDGKPYS